MTWLPLALRVCFCWTFSLTWVSPRHPGPLVLTQLLLYLYTAAFLHVSGSWKLNCTTDISYLFLKFFSHSFNVHSCRLKTRCRPVLLSSWIEFLSLLFIPSSRNSSFFLVLFCFVLFYVKLNVCVSFSYCLFQSLTLKPCFQFHTISYFLKQKQFLSLEEFLNGS